METEATEAEIAVAVVTVVAIGVAGLVDVVVMVADDVASPEWIALSSLLGSFSTLRTRSFCAITLPKWVK